MTSHTCSACTRKATRSRCLVARSRRIRQRWCPRPRLRRMCRHRPPERRRPLRPVRYG